MPARFVRFMSGLLVASAVLGDAGNASATRFVLDDAPRDFVNRGPLPFVLSEAAPDDEGDNERPPVAETTTLTTEQLQSLLARLPPVQAEVGDARPFRLPERSLPPPRPGVEVVLPFPPPPAEPVPDVEAAGPLEVLRFSPEGGVPLAPRLSVTFSQPMVPLTGHRDLSLEEVPVKLSPRVPGHWRWVGTRSLFFEPDTEDADRMPMATEYAVEIPAGTMSANGNELAEKVSWTFHTPAMTLERGYPNDQSRELQPVLFATFDQQINPAAMIRHVRVTAGDRVFPVRLAGAGEVASDIRVRQLIMDTNTLPNRSMAFVADESFPRDTTVTVTFPAGAPSAEGPLMTAEPQSYRFRTYGPLVLHDHDCGWSDVLCHPSASWIVRFSNILDADAFDPALVSIEPQLADSEIHAVDNSIRISGKAGTRTTYKVTVGAGLTDEFGQTLEKDVRVRFPIGSLPAYLIPPRETLTILDPYGEPGFPVYAVNIDEVKVRAFRVRPEQYAEYVRWRYDEFARWSSDSEELRDADEPPDPPGELVIERTLRINGGADALTEAMIPVSDALIADTGHLILYVRPGFGWLSSPLDRLRGQTDRRWLRGMTYATWIQVTQIGLDAFVDGDDVQVWTNRLGDGAPLGGVDVDLWPRNVRGVTDAAGSARLTLPDDRAELLIARSGDDVAFLPAGSYSGGWRRSAEESHLRMYVFDDRRMYRPGESVSIKGWMRRIEHGPEGDVRLPFDRGGKRIAYRVLDPLRNEIAAGDAVVNRLGGFHFRFDLPENVNLGTTVISLDSGWQHTIEVQEFRRPEFEVSAAVRDGPHLASEHAVATVTAAYFAGGPLPEADVEWRVDAVPGSYRPPDWSGSGFAFGQWRPYWWSFDDAPRGLGSESFTARTDTAGTHRLRIDFSSRPPASTDSDFADRGPSTPQTRPVVIDATAIVLDVNRQAWSDGVSLLVHPADRYVGLRTARNFVEQGEPIEVEVVVTDIDGNAIEGLVATLRAARLGWSYRGGSWQEIEKEVQECRVETSSATDAGDGEFAACAFTTSLGGTYRITATVIDAQDRRNQTEITRWVSGGSIPPGRDVEHEKVQLVPDRESYQPGDTAEVLVRAPFFPAEGVLTLRREGLVSTERFSMDGPTHSLRVPIKATFIPNVHVQVDLVGAAMRTDDAGNQVPSAAPRPAYARGSLDLSIPPLSRTLRVDAAPRDERLEPGGETTIDVTVKNARGEPVTGAEFAIVVVDEAILALTGYRLPDPIEIFYAKRVGGVEDYHNRDFLLLAQPGLWAAGVGDRTREMFPNLVMASDGFRERRAGEDDSQAIRARLNLDPLALFAPEVRTDKRGRAEVPVILPDSLTRYRVMVVAVVGARQFGIGESSLTARLPLMVRPSAPRFLNYGDNFELPVVLQNQTGEPMGVHVAARAANADLGTAGYAVTVPANDRVEVRFPAATARAGTARFQFGAIAAERPVIADAAEVALPVFTPGTTEAFAVYGEIDEDGVVRQPLRPPAEAIPGYGGLEVSMSSTALQTLADAFIYLIEYPYECTEQIASRILSVAALRDVLDAFDAPGLPPAEEIEQAMERDLQKLRGMQDDSGGFPIWRRGGAVWPYHSLHVTHALVRARQKGYTVPTELLGPSIDYLRNIEDSFPEWYGVHARRALTAYALYVGKLLREDQAADASELAGEVGSGYLSWQGSEWLLDHDGPPRARKLVREAGLEDLSLETIGWLLFVLAADPASEKTVDGIRRYLQNRVTEAAGTAVFATGYHDGEYLLLHSHRRTDAVLLEALIADRPEGDLITKLVRGLLGHRTKGRWANTQENVWVLLAMDRYFKTFEAQEPDFMARVWLGERYAAGHAFRGRSVDNVNLDVPMPVIRESATGGEGGLALIVEKKGAGRLYYRLGLRYAPADLDLDSADHGFSVQRTYEAVDDPLDVHRGEDGVWHIRAGARVRVKVTMTVPSRRVHVALVDALPAGLEILNPELAVTGEVPPDPNERDNERWWWNTWFEHQNLRDERAEAFASHVPAGVYEYGYAARATTPGTFVVPPARAEEMYAPETFGRSASSQVVVHDDRAAVER